MITEKTYDFPFLKDKAHFYVLDNKHTVIAIKKPGDICNVSTWVKTGSINENDENNGVSHFLEHLMFKGTERFKPGEFDKIMESKGAIINAATWKDYTFYYITIPQGENNENFELAIDLHSDMIINSTLPDEEIGPTYDINNSDVKEKRERSVVIEEISMREDQPWTKTYNNLNALMYTKHPYRRDTIGTREIIASIPRESILDYYKKWYVSENLITIVVSSYEPAYMLELVKKYFNIKSSESSPLSEYELEIPTDKIKINNSLGDTTTGFGILGLHGPKPSNLKHSIAAEVAVIVLGEGRSSRLTQNLIEKPKEPIFNMINCSQYQFRDGNNILVQANFKADQKDEAVVAMKNQLEELKEKPITLEELNKAKKKLESRFAEAAETVSGLAESVGYAMILSNDIEIYTKYLDVLKDISEEDIKEAVEIYFDVEKACISTMTPQ